MDDLVKSHRMSVPSSPSTALVALVDSESEHTLPQWRRIYQGSNAVVLYNPTSHALALHPAHRPAESIPEDRCPYCNQTLPSGISPPHTQHNTRVPNYFHLLSLANEVSSRPSSPTISEERQFASAIPSQSIAQGYFAAFFQEEYRLGMGANGSVYLCQHVLNGNMLGHFAVKKIAVGESPEYLANLLREVRLLESLHHPNIISYHHAWLESCKFSSFGPSIPTLHILMQWAEGGSLDEFIDARLGKPIHNPAFQNDDIQSSGEDNARSRSARIRAFRKKQRASSAERDETRKRRAELGRGHTKAVHLFSAQEVKSIFTDIVVGLGFLHSKSILHLDLKPLNVLLTWDEGSLVPRAMLSDFGTSQDMLGPSRVRSGNTGTLEYSAPETIARDTTGRLRPVDSRADMWSLGMVLYKMVFFNLPFGHIQDPDYDTLEREIASYSGFKSSPEISASLKRRLLPRSIALLLESLLNVTPFLRPTCEQVISAIKEGKMDPLLRDRQADEQMVSLVRKPPSPLGQETPIPIPPSAEWEKETHQTHPESNIVEASEKGDEEVGPKTPVPEALDPPVVEAILPSSESSSKTISQPLDVYVTKRRNALVYPDMIRLAKAGVVIIKVLSLYFTCRPYNPTLKSVTLVLTLALLDTLLDSLTSMLYLGVAHMFVLYWSWVHSATRNSPLFPI